MHDPFNQARRRPRLAGLVGALALTLAVAACAGGGDPSGGVASLAGSGHATSTTSPGVRDERQAALDFARCMRQHGVDMPDPKFDAGGGVTQEGPAGGGKGPEDPTFKAAQQACQHYLRDGGQPSKTDPQRFQQALKFARCMRQHGVDMPDPNPNGPTVQTGNGASNGPKPDDPRFKAAQEACKQYLPGGAGGPSTQAAGGR
ncbi:MAG TPA: hypothetical protein VFD04_11080 [Actinomycetes bacterium]|jgi:hypothetical protein|nr:hypothetical protein [Actinomycetes bacterium]